MHPREPGSVYIRLTPKLIKTHHVLQPQEVPRFPDCATWRPFLAEGTQRKRQGMNP
jgi:hypothetical protein